MTEEIYVYDKDLSDGYNWGVRCDSPRTAERLIHAIQLGIDNSVYAGVKSCAKILEKNDFPNCALEQLEKIETFTAEMMNKVDAGEDVEDVLSNLAACWENDDEDDF